MSPEIELFDPSRGGIIKSTGGELVGPVSARVSVLGSLDERLSHNLLDAARGLRYLDQKEPKRPVKRFYTGKQTGTSFGYERITYFTIDPSEILPPALADIRDILDQSDRSEPLHVHVIVPKNDDVEIFIAPDTLHKKFFGRDGGSLEDPKGHYESKRPHDIFHGAESQYGLPDDQVGLHLDIGPIQMSSPGKPIRVIPKLIGALGYRSASVSLKPRQEMEAIFSNPFTAQQVAVGLIRGVQDMLEGTIETSEDGASFKDFLATHKKNFEEAQKQFEVLFKDGKKQYVEIAAGSEGVPPELAAVMADLGIATTGETGGSAFLVYQKVRQKPVITISPAAISRDNAQLQIQLGGDHGCKWEVAALTSDPVPSNFKLPEISPHLPH